MVAVNANRKVLLTGASGYVGAHVLEVLLRAGYDVRATVRSQKKANQVSDRYKQYKNQLELVIVEDIAKPNVFDDLVKDVAGIFHTASPFTFKVNDVKEDLLEPAKQGTLSVLQAAAKSSTVKRVVITSSAVAILDFSGQTPVSHVYTEKDWSPFTYEYAVESKSGAIGYFTSKKVAEQAAWDFIEKNKPNFDIATLCPPWVFGPFVHHVDKLEDLNESSRVLHEFTTIKTDIDTTPTAHVDVRDVAEAHLAAFERPEASNQRYLLAADHLDTWQHVSERIHKNFPGKTKAPVGTPGKYPPKTNIDNSKAKKDLGLTFRSSEETFNDSVAQYLSWKN